MFTSREHDGKKKICHILMLRLCEAWVFVAVFSDFWYDRKTTNGTT
jgi:hypothetical protein